MCLAFRSNSGRCPPCLKGGYSDRRNDLGPTDTSEPLRSVAVSDSDHQWEEVDFAEPSDGPLRQAAAAQRSARRPTVSITHEPLQPGLATLELVLTTTLQSQGQTLLA